jgi:glycosyltransferase involved in cell wall biosynthesis
MRKIAVITTLYRNDKIDYIQHALDSLVNQTGSFQINIYLCIDGVLPEQLEAIVEKNNLLFYKVIRNEINVGLAKALNNLLDILEDEEYVFRMDMDDFCDGRRMLEQVKLLDMKPEVSLVGTNCYEVDENDNIIGKRVYPQDHEDIIGSFYKIMPLLHPTMCFRAKNTFAEGLRYDDVYLTEDFDLFCRMMKMGHRFYNIQDCLFYYRRTRDFYKRRNLRRTIVEFKTYIKYIDRDFSIVYKILFPAARFIFRITPPAISKYFYNNKVRIRITNTLSSKKPRDSRL